MPTFLVDVSSAACDSVVLSVRQYDTITGGTRHVNKERRHNLNTHVHAGTTQIIRLLATSKIRHIALPEDGPIVNIIKNSLLHGTKMKIKLIALLISNFRLVLKDVLFLFGDSTES